MDPDKWQRIKSLFEAALEKTPAERGEFIAEASGGDESVKAEVESLLAYKESAHSFAGVLEPFAAAVAAQPATEPREVLSDRRIGQYQIVRELGRGGMAVVYLGMRADDQYRKRVAIKLVLQGFDSDEVLRRFRNERQTLAALDHPNIVKLLDGGTIDEGRPYIVMDYVEGAPIDEYCDAHCLSTTERLQLFLQVCSAVHYAHLNLVVHRDLKPSNILVTTEGVPKLLDFGIAKLLNPEYARTLLLTGTNVRLMTPEYASPEQVRGEPVTAVSDVYSLGVVLYGLLTGHRPYRMDRYTPLEIEKAICEREPDKPSTAVSHVEQVSNPEASTFTAITPERVSRTREGDSQKLRRRLQGDLDVIVLKALRKEPQRRYASVYDLSEDIRLHLEHLPIKARRATVAYRARKFIRRHKEAAIATFLFVVLLSAVATWQTRQAKNDYAHLRFTARPSVAVIGFKNLSGRYSEAWLSTALSEWLTAELAAGEKLRTVPGEDVAHIDPMLTGVDGYNRESLSVMRKNFGADFVVVGSYFDTGGEAGGQIRLDLRIQDTVDAQTIATISETGTESQVLDLVSRTGSQLRQRLGLSEPSSSEAGQIRASLPSNPEAAPIYAAGLTKLRSFDALAARDLLQRAVVADPNYALAHSALAAAWWELGYEKKARVEAKTAWDLAGNLSREDHLSIEARYREVTNERDKAAEIYRALWVLFPDNFDYGLRLAAVQVSAGRGKDALATIAELRRLSPRGREDPRIDLEEANAAKSLADYKAEQAAASQAVLKGRSQGARLILARALLLQGGAFGGLGEPAQAVACLSEARQIYAEAGDRIGMAGVLNNLGTQLYHNGDLKGAADKYEEALSIYREIGAKRGIASSLNNLASVLSDQRQLAAAKKMREESISVYQEIGDQRGVAVALGNLANVMYLQGDLSGAVSRYRESLNAHSLLGSRTDTVTVRNNLATLLHEQAELAQAKRVYEESVSICRESGNRRSLAFALSGLASVYFDEGDLAKARTLTTEALQIRNAIGERVNAAVSRIELARVSMEEGHAADAETLARQVADELRSTQRISDEASAQLLIAESQLRQRKLAGAQDAIARASSLLLNNADRETRFAEDIIAARVLGASGKPIEARTKLEATISEATKLGYTAHQLEARLALGEIEINSGELAKGRDRLRVLAKQARAKGFGLILRKASAAAAAQPSTVS